MYLVNNFGPLVLLSSLLAFTLVPGITPPLASAQPGFHCFEVKDDGNGQPADFVTPCHELNSVCWISTETGQGMAKCQPESTEQCGPDPVPHNGSIYCAPGTKHCCCADQTTTCNKHNSQEIKARICAVPELKKSELCCEENGECTSGKPPTGPGGSSPAPILSGVSGFLTGTVGILTLAVL